MTPLRVILLVILTFFLENLTFGVEVFNFSEDGNSAAFLESPLNLETVDGLTICYRLKISRFLMDNTRNLFVIRYDKHLAMAPEFSIGWKVFGPLTLIQNKYVGEDFNMDVKLEHWYHSCHSLNLQTGKHQTVIDGQLLQEGQAGTFKRFKGGLDFMLATFRTETCSPANLTGCVNYFRGDFSDLNIWGEVLTVSQMKDFTTCKQVNGKKAKLLDWQKAEWATLNVSTYELDNICEQKEEKYVILPTKANFEDSFYQCKTLGGDLAAPKTEEIYNTVLELVQKQLAEPSIWIGWTDQYTEGTFIDINKYFFNKTDIVPLPQIMKQYWYSGEPNGKRNENCIEFRSGGSWNDLTCEAELYSLCHFKERPLFRLKGLSTADTRYSLTLDFPNGKPYFFGFHSSHIQFHDDPLRYHPFSQNRWKIFDKQIYFYDDRKLTNPVGRHALQVETPDGLQKRLVTFSVCKREEFTCDNGMCIPLIKRCDSEYDCKDHSDEESCMVYERISSSYRKTLPPLSINERVEEDLNTIPVYLDMTVNSFSNIDVTKMHITVDFILTVSWFDGRLKYPNLKDNEALNNIDSDALTSEFWYPEIIFTNGLDTTMSLYDSITDNFVSKEGNGILEDVRASPFEIMYYAGHENPIVSSRKYTILFECQYELAPYPFDSQQCKITHQLKRPNRERGRLVFANVTYVGEPNLLEYLVVNVTSSKEFACGRRNMSSCVDLVVNLKRQIGNQLANTYLPTICLLSTIYFTHFYHIDHYDVRLQISLTGMLVISSLFVSASASLPKTSFLKMIDIWMLFCFLLPFLEIILHTIIEYMGTLETNNKIFAQPLEEEAEAKRTLRRKIDYFGRVTIPFLFLGFNIWYWVCAL